MNTMLKRTFSTRLFGECVELCFMLRMQLNDKNNHKLFKKNIPKEFKLTQRRNNCSTYKVDCIYCKDKITFSMND